MVKELIIVIPAYNEEENIIDVVNDWYPIVEKVGNNSELVIIDDGSKDSTYHKLEELAKDKHQLKPINKENSGHGATLLFGYQYAINNGAQFIFQTDSDGQTLPEEFLDFWKIRNEYDLVIGHRTNRKDGFSRYIVTKVLKLVLFIIFGENVRDANTPFRLYKGETLKKYINFVPEQYNLSNVALTVIYSKFKLNTKYLPITFRERQGGINSINMKKIFQIGKKALADFLKIKENLRKVNL